MSAGRGNRATSAATLAASILLGVVVIAFPTLAGSETVPTVSTAVAPGEPGYAWSPEQVSVLAGGEVTFANTTPGVPHGIKWTSSAKPTCSSSVPVGEEKSSEAKWSGTCTFADPGTYTFDCTVHGPGMAGKIVVTADGTVTTTTTTQSSSSGEGGLPKGSGEPEPEPESGSGSPFAGGPSKAVKLAKLQHGSKVHGKVNVSGAGAGGRLVVELFAKGLTAAKRGHSSSTRVGRTVRGSLKAGEIAFVVRLNQTGTKALLRRHTLALTAKISLASRDGKTAVLTRKVALHT